MADAELHIIVKQAGDPEKLGALLNAVIAMKNQERPVKVVVPSGYRCVECYRDDGRHELTCSCRSLDQLRETIDGGEAPAEHHTENATQTGIQQGG